MCLVLQKDFSYINIRELLITLFLSLFWPEISFVLWHTVCFQWKAKPTRLPWCWCRWCKVMQNLQEGYCSHRQLYWMQSSPSEVSVNGEVEQDKIYWLWNSNWKSLYLCIYYKYSCSVGFGVRKVAMIRSAVILYFFWTIWFFSSPSGATSRLQDVQCSCKQISSVASQHSSGPVLCCMYWANATHPYSFHVATYGSAGWA